MVQLGSPKLLVLATVAVVLGLPGVAAAAITPTTDALEAAGAFTESLPGGVFAGAAAFEAIPPNPQCSNGLNDDNDSGTDFPADSQCTSPTDNSEGSGTGTALPSRSPAAVSTTALGTLPRSGPSYAILSTGDTTRAADPNQSGVFPSVDNAGGNGGHGPTFRDVVTLRVDVVVPVGSNCLSVDFAFLSEEFPNFVGQGYNDGFVAELGGSTFSASGPQAEVSAPNNFAFDSSGKVISVNTTGFSAESALGTPYGGATPVLRASTPVTAGPRQVYLSVFDQADRVYDSSVLLDRMRVFTAAAGQCQPGALDLISPETTITRGPPGLHPNPTPTFEFESDEPNSTFECRMDDGPFEPCSSPFTTSPLEPGVHTFAVRATDVEGNPDGSPETRTFAIQAPEAPPRAVAGETASLEPDYGTKVVVVPVGTGEVYVKLPGSGRFVKLETGMEIPVGTVVDTRKGIVRLTSEKTKEGDVQTSDFFGGVFKVKQPKKRKLKGQTELVLTGSLSGCKVKSGRANAAKRRKRGKRRRRLWGRGKGRFKTRGRYGAGSVRGTTWLTEDRCDGTLFKVKEGTIVVRDFKRRKNVKVKAPKKYVAKARRRRR